MWWKLFFAALLGCAGCGVAPQPESAETVAAYEVPLLTRQERDGFLALVSREAKAEGLHLDAASPGELERTAQAMPEAAMTVHAAVWRGTEDDDSEAVIMDQRDHLGLVWIMFSRGENPALASRFRDRLMSKIIDRWPETQTLPITPTGAIPLHRDLRRTPEGYRVEPSAAETYQLPPSSPLIARDD
jgi:hypothetical protein